ncbi:MAG: M1 family metallopeptidase, partial [Bacteroidota bacterium]
QRVSSLTQDNKPVKFETVGTILEVELADPILPGGKTEFVMAWQAQVPIQIRRSGRDNAEGIRYSMSQWYPKMAEYDIQGWHANPYIGREFHGVWGDFDVTIHIDREYIIGGTGYLQNPQDIGYGYAKDPEKRKKKISYHFKAPNVHDFVWAADPDYTHTSLKREDGTTMHFFYQENENTKDNWEALPKIMDAAFAYINKHYGPYPYEQYSFIQGGDGGMEYPMATLITGERSLNGLVGVSVHELMHTWYQMLMGTNEALYAWMDEGFTSWASREVTNHLREKKLIPGDAVDNPHLGTYLSLIGFRESGLQEPLSTHADHFNTNAAYGVAAYVKGAVWLEQLRYIIGEEAFQKTLLQYYDTWRFKHPTPNDFVR